MVLLAAISMTLCNTVCVSAKDDIDLENILSREATIEEVEEVGKRIEQEKIKVERKARELARQEKLNSPEYKKRRSRDAR